MTNDNSGKLDRIDQAHPQPDLTPAQSAFAVFLGRELAKFWIEHGPGKFGVTASDLCTSSNVKKC